MDELGSDLKTELQKARVLLRTVRGQRDAALLEAQEATEKSRKLMELNSKLNAHNIKLMELNATIHSHNVKLKDRTLSLKHQVNRLIQGNTIEGDDIPYELPVQCDNCGYE